MDADHHLKDALSDRYAIASEIDTGGMATVYRARDLKHDRTVAVKVLRADLAEAIGADRFLREIRTTANLSHPHILPLFDSGEAAGFLYYVMPFVEGESLQDRLDREGQLPVEEATQIAREVAEALAYAHEKGVIHRDIKPANILLERGHALLMDFGIAQAKASADETRLTGMGMSPGTPAYMSPEQISGQGRVDGRSDQYALACVLYEMLAGHAPFTGTDIQTVMSQHLAVVAPKVTGARAAVPKGVAKALHRALAKAPADRYRTVAEFEKALAGATLPLLARIPMGRARGVIFGSTFVLALAVAAAVGSLWPSAPPEMVLTEDRVVVFPFEDLTGDPAHADLGRYAAEWITDGLSRVPEVRVVPFGTVLEEVTHWAGSATAAEMARGLDAGIMVTGIVTAPGNDLQLRAEIIRVANREMIQSVDASGPVSEPREPLVEVLGQRLMGTLALEIEWGGSTLFRPPTYEAYQALVQGGTAFDARDWEAAVRHFSEAVEADSTLLGELWWLAMAYANMGGHRTQVDSLVRILQERKSELTPVERLQLEYFTAPDIQSRIRTLQALREMDPLTIGWHHDLARNLQSLGRIEEAWEVLSDVDLDHWGTQSWSFFWYSLAQVSHLTGRYQEELEVARRAQELFPGDLFHVRSELNALLALGRLEEMTPILDRLQESTEGNPTNILRQVSRELAFFGYAEESQAVAQRAIDWTKTWSQNPNSLGMAISLLQAGRPAEAAPMLRRLVAEDPENDARMGWLGIALAQTGDTEGAERMIRELDGLGPRYWLFQALILGHLDRKDEAARRLNQGLRDGLNYMEIFDFNYFGTLRDHEPFRQVIAPRG